MEVVLLLISICIWGTYLIYKGKSWWFLPLFLLAAIEIAVLIEWG